MLVPSTVNPQTKNLDFRGLDSSRFSMFKGFEFLGPWGIYHEFTLRDSQSVGSLYVDLAAYTRSPLEDSRLFGPSPWKILAATNEKYYLSNPAPGENILSGNLVMETGYTVLLLLILLLLWLSHLLLLLLLHLHLLAYSPTASQADGAGAAGPWRRPRRRGPSSNNSLCLSLSLYVCMYIYIYIYIYIPHLGLINAPPLICVFPPNDLFHY